MEALENLPGLSSADSNGPHDTLGNNGIQNATFHSTNMSKNSII